MGQDPRVPVGSGRQLVHSSCFPSQPTCPLSSWLVSAAGSIFALAAAVNAVLSLLLLLLPWTDVMWHFQVTSLYSYSTLVCCCISPPPHSCVTFINISQFCFTTCSPTPCPFLNGGSLQFSFSFSSSPPFFLSGLCLQSVCSPFLFGCLVTLLIHCFLPHHKGKLFGH